MIWETLPIDQMRSDALLVQVYYYYYYYRFASNDQSVWMMASFGEEKKVLQHS